MDVKKLIEKMTLKEKLAQMSQFTAEVLSSLDKSEVTGEVGDYDLTSEEISSIGSVLGISGEDNIRRIQDEHLKNDPNKIPLVFMADVIHGYKTIYPVPLGLGATFDKDLVYECAKMASKESSLAGISVTFSPMVDLVRDARWGRVMETTGEDTFLNSIMARAQVNGYQGKDNDGKLDSDRVSACVKHFANYGGAESGKDYNTVYLSDQAEREWYLPAYKACVEENAKMVMTSFNLTNGVPSTGNKRLLKDILRKEWGFDGVIITDYNAVYEQFIHGYAKDKKDCAVKAISATSDIEMMSNTYIKHGEDAVKENLLSEKEIDECVYRILKLKDDLGLFENPYYSANKQEENKVCLSPKHRELARISAEKSAVLLKNDNVLPFTDVKSIAVIGPFIDTVMLGAWHAQGNEKDGVTILQAIKNNNPDIKVLDFKFNAENEKDYAKQINIAEKLAKKADAVLLAVGEHYDESGEGKSKTDIALNKFHAKLVKDIVSKNKKTAVCIFNGRPLVLTDIANAPCYFTIWQPGTECGNAIYNLIFNKTNFEGKLPMTFPRAVGQLPIYYNHTRSGRPKSDDTVAQPFRCGYIDCINAPLFPFGYGLSYTNFSISPVVLDKTTFTKNEKVTASVKVKNTGTVKGTETVQLYICDKVASLVRPIKELKGFKKVTLTPNEETTVSFTIDEKLLSFYSENKKFEIEKGEFEIYIDNSSDVKNPVVLEYI